MRLRDQRIEQSYPVRLTCQSIGWPVPRVTWYKDSKQIYSQGEQYGKVCKF